MARTPKKPGGSAGMLSWLSLADAKVGASGQAVLDATRAKLGFVRTSQRLLTNAPEVLVAQDALSRAVMNPENGNLSIKERELIALVVSVENRCASCIFGHASRLRGITGDPVWVGEVEANYRHAHLTPRELAIADYAVELTRSPGDVRSGDLERMRRAGLSDGDILYVATIAAYFNLSNRINNGLGVRPNSEAYLAGR